MWRRCVTCIYMKSSGKRRRIIEQSCGMYFKNQQHFILIWCHRKTLIWGLKWAANGSCLGFSLSQVVPEVKQPFRNSLQTMPNLCSVEVHRFVMQCPQEYSAFSALPQIRFLLHWHSVARFVGQCTVSCDLSSLIARCAVICCTPPPLTVNRPA